MCVFSIHVIYFSLYLDFLVPWVPGNSSWFFRIWAVAADIFSLESCTLRFVSVQHFWANLAACSLSPVSSSAVWPSPLYHLHNPLTDILLWTLTIHSSWLSMSASARRLIHWKNTLKSQISGGTISNRAIICCIAISPTLSVSYSQKRWVCMRNHCLEARWSFTYLIPLWFFIWLNIIKLFFCCTASMFTSEECWASPDMYSSYITILSFISSWTHSWRQRC